MRGKEDGGGFYLLLFISFFLSDLVFFCSFLLSSFFNTFSTRTFTTYQRYTLSYSKLCLCFESLHGSLSPSYDYTSPLLLNMIHQRQYQQPTNGGAGSKAPLLVLGAAALMIQGLLVLPTSANKAETTINISSSNSNNNDASVMANSGNSKVLFDLGVHHNLQTIASLSTGGAGPAGAGPQLWGTTFTAGMVSNSKNATTPANFQQGQEQEQDRQQKDALEGVSSALYRKIRLEEPSDAPATAVDSTAPMAASVKDVRVVGEVEDIQSGETEPEVDEDLEKEGKELLSQLV